MKATLFFPTVGRQRVQASYVVQQYICFNNLFDGYSENPRSAHVLPLCKMYQVSTLMPSRWLSLPYEALTEWRICHFMIHMIWTKLQRFDLIQYKAPLWTVCVCVCVYTHIMLIKSNHICHFATLIIRNVSWAVNQYIRMISERSCDTEDCWKRSFASQNKLHLKTSQ